MHDIVQRGVSIRETPASHMENISVVIPVYNSEASLPPLVERLEPVLQALAQEYELILVNDGSADKSWEVVCRLAQDNAWIRGIDLLRNSGQHNALLCGIRHARYDVTLTIDDDLQHPPEEIPKLIDRLHDGYDVVYGTPEAETHGLMRNIASILTKLALQKAMGVDTARKVSAFRAFRTDLRKAFQTYNGSFVSIDVLLTWGATRFDSIAVTHEPRTLGQSNYTWYKLLTHAFNMITGFSVFPLEVASLMGFAMTGFGLLVLIYVVGRYFISGVAVPGFAFLASTMAIFSGAQLFALGILGEYIARMHTRLLDRPSYTISSETPSDS